MSILLGYILLRKIIQYFDSMAQGMSPVGGRVRNRGRGLLEVTRGCSRKGRIGGSQNALFSASLFSSRPLKEVSAHFSASCIHDFRTRRLSG